jgi:hypothetical protein
VWRWHSLHHERRLIEHQRVECQVFVICKDPTAEKIRIIIPSAPTVSQ